MQYIPHAILDYDVNDSILHSVFLHVVLAAKAYDNTF